MTVVLSVILHSSEKNNLCKGNHLAKNKPDVYHLDVRGGGQALHLADEDGGHHQHGGQIHTQGRLKEEGLEEGGGKGDCSQKDGWKVGGHHLASKLSFHDNNHTRPFFVTIRYFVLYHRTKNLVTARKLPFIQTEDGHVNRLAHGQITRDQIHIFTVQTSHCHVNGASLNTNVKIMIENFFYIPGCQRDMHAVRRHTEMCECRFDS